MNLRQLNKNASLTGKPIFLQMVNKMIDFLAVFLRKWN